MKKQYQLLLFLAIVAIPTIFVFAHIFKSETVTIMDKGREFLYYTFYYKDVKALFQDRGYDEIIADLRNQFMLFDEYFIRKGDTIWKISFKYRLKKNEVIALILLNYIVDPDEIYVGQRLGIYKERQIRY